MISGLRVRDSVSLGESELGVSSGVLEDGLVSGDGLLEGGGLLVDGGGVGLDGGLVALVGGGSGSGGNTLGLIGSLISGLGGGVVGNGGFVLSGSSGIGLGSIFSEGVLGVEIGVSAVLGVGGSLELNLGSGHGIGGSGEVILGLVPGLEGGGSVLVGGGERGNGDLVVGNGLELSGESGSHLGDGEVVMGNGLLVNGDGGGPGGVPSKSEGMGGGLLILGGEVFVGSHESSLDKSGVLLDEGSASGLSFLEVVHGSEEGVISEGGVLGGGDDGEGGDNGDLGEHVVRLGLLKLIISLGKQLQVNENNPIKHEK